MSRAFDDKSSCPGMKTLLQINTNVGWNATGMLTESIGRHAIDAGWMSYAAYGRDMNGRTESASKLIKIGNRADQIAHGIITRIADRHGTGSENATRNLIRSIDAINPDIIHLHNIHGYYLNYETLFAYLKRTDKPVVWTLHDCWPFTGHCAYFSMASCTRWKDGCHSCPLSHEYPASIITDNSRRNYEHRKRVFTSVPNLHIVTVSDWLNVTLRQSFLGKFPIYTIHNYMAVKNHKIDKDTTPTVLAVASNWEERKGLEYVKGLRALLPERIKMRVVGLSKAQINSLPAGIEGLPRINEREELMKIYASASVFINTSMADNLPMVNMEALSCGTPVVAFNSGGMAETISEHSGIIVRSGDVRSMAHAIHKVLSMPERYSAESCRNFISEKFSKDNTLGMYLELYESLIPSLPDRSKILRPFNIM